MSVAKGRNTRIEIAKTYAASPLAVTAVTLNKPPVATTAGTLPAVNSYGYFDAVTGMAQLDGQPGAVIDPTAGTFKIQSLDTSSYSAYTGGNWIGVTAWALLSKATSYEIPNAESDKLDGTCLIDIVRQEEAGLLAAQSVTLSGFSDPTEEAVDLINSAAINGTPVLVRMTLSNGQRRVYRGTPSLPGESLSVGTLATMSLSFATKGRVMFLPAVV